MAAVITLLFCVFCSLFFCPRVCASADSAESGKIGAVSDYLSGIFEATRFPAMSVIVVDGDGVLFSENYGQCESSDTPFLLGSVTKSFTALGIMQLAEEGKIELNAAISTYLPQAKYGDRITVLQLLNHTSGLGEHHNLTNYKIVGEQGRHVYANVNYSLLGKIIESASGQDYGTYIAEHIFSPLGMTHSAATYEESVKNGLIDGYTNYFGINVKTKPHYPKDDNSWISTSAGYLSSSAVDLGKYLQMYINGGRCAGGEILSQSGINKMFSAGVRVETDIPYDYCLGWTKIGEPMGETVMRHSGLVETGMSCLYVLPESGLGIAVLVNCNDYFVGKDFMDRLDWGLAMLLTGMQPNVIGSGEYAIAHAFYDLAYIAVLIISILPLCLFKIWLKILKKEGKRIPLIIDGVAVHLLLPSLILAFAPLFFATPLWVVADFVPDLFITVIFSSVILFMTGAAKAVIYVLFKKGLINFDKRKRSNI